MKIQSQSPHAFIVGSLSDYLTYDAYDFIPHTVKSGKLSTLTVARAGSNLVQFDKFIKVRFKGTKSATLTTSPESNSLILCENPSSSATTVESLNVSAGSYFYVRVDSNGINDIVFYEDEDGKSPLLRVYCDYGVGNLYATGHYITEGYSNGTYLNSIPDSMDNYSPDLEYYPVLEVVRDFYINQYGMSNIPSEFRSPLRIQCTPRAPNVFGTESTFNVVFDKLRQRLYLPYEDGTYAVITQLPSGIPLEAGWNTKHQKLVCMYPRKLVEVDLDTQVEEILWEPQAEDPDLKYLHVGTYDDYHNTVFIGCASETKSWRGHWTKTGSTISTREETVPSGKIFTSPPYSSAIKAAITSKSDGLSRNYRNDVDATFENKDGYSLATIYDRRSDEPLETYAMYPVMVEQLSFGTKTHGSDPHDLFTYNFQLRTDGRSAIPVASPTAMSAYQKNIRPVHNISEDSTGASIEFDTVSIKSGQSSPYTSDPRWKPTINPEVIVYCKLYPDLPDRFSMYRDNYDFPFFKGDIVFDGELEPNTDIDVFTIPESAWITESYENPKLPFGENAEVDAYLPSGGLDLTTCVINRKSGEVKVPHTKVGFFLQDLTGLVVENNGTSEPYVTPYSLTVPEPDDPLSKSDTEIVSLGGTTFFRHIDYGSTVESPDVEFDYIKAVRVDRFHWTNVVDMKPVTDNVGIKCLFPAGLKVWVNGDVYIGDKSDSEGVLHSELLLVVDNTHTFQLEVKSPDTYDSRKEVLITFNETKALIVIETPPIQGMNVDGLTTKTTQKSVASVCDHHQQVLSKVLSSSYTHNQNIEMNRPLDFYRTDIENTLRYKPSVIEYHEGSVNSYPDSITSVEHTQMSVLIPEKKIDFIYHSRSGTISDFSTDWIHMSSPVANKREMNYWIHTDLQHPHTREMNYWGVTSKPTTNLRNHNQWISLDNIYHIAASLLLRLPPYHHLYAQHTWTTDSIHTPNIHHLPRASTWIQSKSSPNLYEVEWTKTATYNPVFAFGWISGNLREPNLFEIPWKKHSDITGYRFDSLDSVHSYIAYDFDRKSLSHIRYDNLFSTLYDATYLSNFYSSNRHLNFIKNKVQHLVEKPLSFVSQVVHYLPDMIERKMVESEGTYVVYEESPQGYFATEELAYQAAISEGYDPEHVLIMTQEYYPNAWIFSIRFKRVGICPKAVEYGYVRGG